MSRFDLHGRKAVVTGGAQGIGAGIVRGLAEAGATVTIVDRQSDKARALAEASGPGLVVVTADIGSAEGCRQAISQARDAMGGLDILVNNAAPARNREMIGRIADVDWADHESIVLHAAAAIAESALDDLVASGHGAIVNVSSILATSIGADQSSLAYHVSKAGLNQFTRWLAVRCGASGVRVNAVAPGLVDRDVGHKLTANPVNKKIVDSVVPLRRAGTARDIADAVIFLASDAAAYVTGQVLTIDGGLGINEVFGASLRAYTAAGER
ncbi:MAG: SDR family oxidoreductase [Proteobacteria bacterium]|nr:SDR family oxidoreductase [Pseudomonadota bacterium]